MAIEAVSSIKKGAIDAFATGGGAGTLYAVTVDFGSVPVAQKFFSVSVAGAALGNKVVISPSLDMPAGITEDELEMDMLVCAGRVTAADTVRILVSSVNGGTLTGQRNLNLILG